MKNKFFKGLVASFALAVSGFANAGLIEVDYEGIVGADTAITYDTNTGLEWLDLTETNGISYSSMLTLLGSGQQYEGWRYANYDEVATIFDYFGLRSYANGGHSLVQGSAEDIAIESFTQLFGDTVGEYGNYYGVLGILVDDLATSVARRGVYITGGINGTYTYNETGLNACCTHSVTSSPLYMGSYLVREAKQVPEPSSLAVFALGLMGLASRKFKKQA